MRNPERIDDFCARLAKVWKEEFSDWRFFQLISNINRWCNSDNFYREDDSGIEIIEAFGKDIEEEKRKKIHIYVDLDGVIFDTLNIIKSMYDEDYGYYPDWVHVDADKINHYDFSELKLAPKEYFNKCFESSRYFVIATTLLKINDFISKFLDSGEFVVTFVSLGTKNNLTLKQKWISETFDKYFENIEFIGGYSNEWNDKSFFDMSDGILIDDSQINLETSNAKLKICFGGEKCWNKDWHGLRGKDWNEIYEIIKREYVKS